MKFYINKINIFLESNAKLISAAIIILFIFSGIDLKAASGTPAIISYQGRLADSGGNLLPTSGSSATYYFKFSIWDNTTVDSGSKLWPLTVPATTTATVRQGVFNVNIGDVANGYPDLLNFDFNTSSDVYLQVEVSSDNDSSQTLSPRQRIAASAFSRLASAVSGSTTPSSFGTTTPIGNSVVTIEATSTNAFLLSLRAALNQVANLFQVQDSSGTNLFFANNIGGLFASSTFQVTGATTLYGNLGIATTTPSQIFSVQGNGLFSGDLSLANFTASGTTRFNGVAYSWPSSVTNGNFLQTDSSGNLTWASASSGGTDGNWSFISTDGGYIRLATTTNLVGIGTTTPYAKLSIGQTSGTGVATTTLALQPVSGQLANIIDIYNTAGNLNSVFTSANFLGISTTSPATNLSVQGNALISGLLTTGNLTATNTVTFNTALSVSSGGTGLASYTAGDILYASGVAKLSTVASSTDGFILSLTNGKPIWAATTTFSSPLSYADGAVSCTNCLNTATANGPLAITSSNSSYIFNASSSPFFGTLFATSTVTLSGGRTDYKTSSTSTIPNLAINAFSIATSTSNIPVLSISTSPSPFGLLGVGTTSPSQLLSVGGSAFIGATSTGSISGGLGVGQATTTSGAIEASGLILSRTAFANTGSATSTFSGGIQVLGTGNVCLPNGTCIGAASGSGITSLNGLTDTSQTFSTNGPLDIVSTAGGTVHTFNASSSPFFGTLFASSTVRFSNLGAGAVSANSLGVLSSGTLTAANGGTGLASYTAGDILYASGVAKLSTVASSTDGFILSLTNGKPIWAATTTFSSPLSYADGAVSCTNCLNTATANGPLAITSSNSSYIFNASSSPSFGFLNATSSTNSWFMGKVGIGTTSPAQNLSVQGNGLISGDLTLANLTATGTVNVGTTTRTAALNLDGSTSANNGVASLYGLAALSHGSGAAFASRFTTTVANSAVATSEGLLFRMIDNTSGFGNNQLVRAIEVQANRGVNTEGVNTGILAFGKTFGLQGVTTGSAAGNLIPAGVYAENQGTSTGVALKAYTSTSTTADLVSFYQEGTQTFSGTGLNMQLGMGSSFFAGNFLKFASGTSVTVLMTNTGSTTLGNGVYQAGLAIPFGGLCVDSDGTCNASTTGRISSVTSTLGNSDLAENYFSDETLEPGDTVKIKPSVDGQHASIGKAQSAGDPALIGIVSSAPGVILGSRYEEDAANSTSSFRVYPIALSGRVPVKISLENGPVHQGDNLTSASEKGFAMKARPGDPIVGYALEDWGGPDASVGVAGDSLLVQTEIKQKINLRQLTDASVSDSASADNYKDHGGGVDAIDEEGVAKQNEKTPPSGKTSDVLTSSTSDVEEGGGQTHSSIPRILAFVQRSHSKLDITGYDYFAASENKPLWSIDQATGELKKGFFMDMKEADIVNARSLLSSNGNWSIDENGKLTVKEIQTDKLCIGQTCVTENELKALLEKRGIAPAPSETGGKTSSVSAEGGSASGGEEPVPDTTPPTIAINGNNPAEIDVGVNWADPGIAITDNVSQNLGYTASVDGPPGGEASGPEFPQGDGLQIDTSQPGTHTIIYTATDQAGNKGTATRIVKVINPNETLTASSTTL